MVSADAHDLLSRALDDGVTVQGPHGEITLRLHHVGSVIITSGRIVAWDPLWVDETTPSLRVSLHPGEYPVVLTIAAQVPAYATLLVREGRPIRWDIARFDDGEESGGEHEDAAPPGYPVDTGIGCFADVEGARVFAQRNDADAEYHMVIARGMDASDPSGQGWGCGVVNLEPDTRANLVYFSAGAGDGDYVTYAGYDADDNLVCLTTDFAVLMDGDGQTSEE